MPENALEKLCSKCGQPGDFCRDKSTKDGLSAWCRVCRTASNKRWVAAHPDQSSEIVKRYRAKNPEKVSAATMAWQINNRDRRLSSRRKWYADNPEKARASTKRYATGHPDQVLANNRRRRALLLGAESTLTKAQWEETLEFFCGACAYCHRIDRPLTQDHVIALARGGSHTQENVVPACRPCNSRKGDRPVWVMVGP